MTEATAGSIDRIRTPRALARLRAPDLAAMAGGGEGRLVVWLPILIGCGIGMWFSWPVEPGAMSYGAVVLIAALAGAAVASARRRGQMNALLIASAIGLIALGFLLAGQRAHHVAAPVLGFHYYGPVEGRLIEVDRSARDRLRLTLDAVTLRDVAPARTPARVRVALMGVGPIPPPGTRIMLTAHLSPPSGPAEPGGYDFRRQAWFLGLGGIGYSRDPVMIAAPAPPPSGLSGWGEAADRLRMRLSVAMQDRIGGQAGAVASALMTGDRSGIAEATNEAMRASNLYHIVSISGLHMSMLAGFVFAGLRLGLAGLAAAGGAVGARVLGWPIHKIAAGGALIAATFYLWLAGPNVATERAFLMVAVMLGAILADRRALSLRTLALAALVILVREPESLTEPGFQMSFAATAALILSARPWQRVSHHVPALLRPAAMLVISSLIASLATAPIAAATFNRMAEYGLLANLLVVPVMGALVMPAGVIAALLAPVGLAGPALWVMGLGTRWMLAVAEWIAAREGAVTAVAAAPAWALPLIGIGAIAAGGFGGRARLLGLVPLAAGLGLWLTAPRPAVLISADGKLIGLMTAEGRALSRSRGAGFAAQSWLEADGDLADQPTAARRAAFTGPANARQATASGLEILHLTGRKSLPLLAAACQPGTLIVTDQPGPDALMQRREGAGTLQPPTAPGGCLLMDATLLQRSGAVALDLDGAHAPRIRTANTPSRLWSPAPKPRIAKDRQPAPSRHH